MGIFWNPKIIPLAGHFGRVYNTSVRQRKLRSEKMTNEYWAADKERAKLGDRNACSVVALTIVTGKSYKKCYDALKKVGRKHGDGARVCDIFEAAALLGKRVTIAPQSAAIRKAKTVNQIEKVGVARTRKYLVIVNGHILAVAGGKVHDWTSGRKHRPKYIYQVISK